MAEASITGKIGAVTVWGVVMPTFVALLASHRPASLGGRTLAKALEISERTPPELARLFSAWSQGPAGMYRARPQYTGMCELCLDITNVPELVARVRERLCDHDAQALVAAARMWQVHHNSTAVA